MTCALRIACASADVICANDILSISFMSSAENWHFWGAGAGAGAVDVEASDASDASGTMT